MQMTLCVRHQQMFSLLAAFSAPDGIGAMPTFVSQFDLTIQLGSVQQTSILAVS